ncbi:alpha-1,2-fucosyltransferase [Gammaproteobacteria bacterium]|nr:alpha-1,2-fucosyltransferase [Gammaproteobacteria bacterium]|tara:strand:+ start:12265 stop:13155 length:891 start_codon:yes stop_codon:yes gene_type:complete
MSELKKNKKITVEIVGGLGNQIFCYAAGYAYAKRNNAILIQDISFFKKPLYGREYNMHRFDINKNIISSSFYSVKFFRNIAYFFSKYFTFTGSVIENDPHKLESKFFLKMTGRKSKLYGYWQDERYFLDYRDILLEQLTLKKFTTHFNSNNKLLSSIRSEDSVCIHYRSYSEVEIDNKNTDSIKLNKSYYIEAINQVLNKKKHPIFYLFGDEPSSEIEEMLQDCHVVKVNWNVNKGDEINDLFLMSKCNTLVLANSSFSWWAGWLSSSNDVFFPEKNNLIYYPTPSSKWNIVQWKK